MAFFMDNITNHTKLHSGKQDQTYGFLRLVMFKEYDPETNRVKVAIFDPHDGEHGKWSLNLDWFPLMAQTNGQGFDNKSGKLHGHVFTPTIDAFGYLLPVAGDPNGGIIIGGIYNDSRPPPEVDDKFTKAGEYLYKHATGSYMKFSNNGDITFYSTGNMIFHSDKNKTEHVVGDIVSGAEGNQTITGTSIMLNANAQILLNAPEVSTTQNFTAGNGTSGTFTSVTGQTILVKDGIVVTIYGIL